MPYIFRIIAALSLEERGLFRERIRFLDKKIHPGLSKLTWMSRGISEYFVADCRNNASKIQLTVDDYKGANTDIAAKCVRISQLLLLKIEPKRVYEKMDFDSSQVSNLCIVKPVLNQSLIELEPCLNLLISLCQLQCIYTTHCIFLNSCEGRKSY